MASNQDNGRRADALILYMRLVARARNATAAQLFGESAGRAVSGYEVLDPGVVREKTETCRPDPGFYAFVKYVLNSKCRGAAMAAM